MVSLRKQKVIVAGTAVLLSVLCTLAAPTTVSVCTLMSEPDTYEGKVIATKGLFERDDSGDWRFDQMLPLQGENCYRSAREDELTIKIEGPDKGLLANAPKDFKFDLRSIERLGRSLKPLLAKEPTLRFVEVEAEGIIYSGGPEPHGVTRHPWHPATLVVSTMKNLRKP